MHKSDTQLKKIQNKSDKIFQIIQSLKSQPGFYDETCERWEEVCVEIPQQVEQGLIKVAVTGAVKSGKSTFINSIFKTDFLKRGAGVVTSVVTRIQKGHNLTARLGIKSWDQINCEVEEALLSLGHDCLKDNTFFDFRRKSDKKCLQKMHDKMLEKTSFASDSVKSEKILINNFLKNYDFCSGFIKPDEYIFELQNEDFFSHKEFTGDPSKAFFIQDAKLEVNFGEIASYIEIADCQGIDSTDTAQLSLVLEYLQTANMILYLISSRTGVREADVRLLSIIFKMGIGDNVIFIVNCDLNEHGSLDDLKDIEERIKQDIGYFGPDLNVFSFSSLYNLYSQDLSNLSEKEEQQVKIWESDKDIIDFSSVMTEKFFSWFEKKVKTDREKLIFSNPSLRLLNITTGLKNRVQLFSDTFLSTSADSNADIQELSDIQAGFDRLENLVRNSREVIEKDLHILINSEIDNFFSDNNDSVINRINSFIDHYVVDFNKFEEQVFTIGFPKALFLIFRDFKNAFDCFLVEKIDPEFRKFVKDQENELDSQASLLYESYKNDIYNLYKKFGIMAVNINCINDLLYLKQKLGIKAPPIDFATRYNAKMKIGSFTGLGIYSFFIFIMKKVGKESQFVEKIVVQKLSIIFKKEVLKSIKIQINDYKQKIKKDYFNILVEALSKEITDFIVEQLRIYSVDIKRIESEMVEENSVKAEQKKLLNQIKEELEVLS